MEYIVHGSKNQIDSSFFTYFGAISLKRMRHFDLHSFKRNRSKLVKKLLSIKYCTFIMYQNNKLFDNS